MMDNQNIAERLISNGGLLANMEEPLDYRVISDEEHYRTSRFIKALGGDNPRNRILDCLVELGGTPVTYEYVREETSLTKDDVEEVFKVLIKEGKVINTKDNLYSLNLKNPDAKKLIDLGTRIMLENFIRLKQKYLR